MFCKYCGKELGPKIEVCPYCGMPVVIFGVTSSQEPQNVQYNQQAPQGAQQFQPAQPSAQFRQANQAQPDQQAPLDFPQMERQPVQQPVQQSVQPPVQQSIRPMQGQMPQQGGSPFVVPGNSYGTRPGAQEAPYGQQPSPAETSEDSDVWFPPKPERTGMPRGLKITLIVVLDLILVGAIVFFIFFWDKGGDTKETRSTKTTTISGQNGSDESDVSGTDESGVVDTKDTKQVPDDSSDTADTDETTEPSTDPAEDNMLKDPKKIDQVMLGKFRQYSESLYKDQEVKTYPASVNCEKINYLGYYFLVPKDKTEAGVFEGENGLFLVYQVILAQEVGGSDIAREYFWYCGFTDIQADGTADLDKNIQPKASVNFDKQYKLKGYSSVDKVYSALVTKNKAKYSTVENKVDKTKIEELPVFKNNGMVFPESDKKKIDTKLIPSLSHEDLRAAINEIWARHGYIFRNESVLTYYRQFSWYKEKIPADEWDRYGQEHYLNSVEMENINELAKERDKRKANGTYPY